ncbi:DUF4239 domain-containing protein [Kitasatospora sp. NPDC048365]|uniref:bestrophin-like domain n=1 Tax=Kitasatospora sp. NPDC048365 TaxID=3364050 RepID=UPI003720720D
MRRTLSVELWLLNHLSTLVLAFAVVGGVVVLAVAGSVLTSRLKPSLVSGEHNDMVGVVLGMFGAIYGIILAFVIVNLWTQLETTETVVATEATAASQIVRDARVFPDADRARVNAAVADYVHAVVEQQWPLMRAGAGDFARTADRVEAMYQSLRVYEPQTQAEQAFYGQAVDSLDELVAQRRARIAQSNAELPTLLKALVFGGALVILPLTFLYGIRSQGLRLLFVGSVAGLIGFSLLLVVVLDRPFAGDLCVSPMPFKQSALAQFWPVQPGPTTSH